MCRSIALMVLLICSFLFYQQQSAGHRALEKDYVSCLSITKRHTACRAWNCGACAISWRWLRPQTSSPPLKLHVSQPAQGRQIRDLEDELGVQLFERTVKSVNLTDAGSLFLKEAREILEPTDEAARNVRAFVQAG